MSLGRFQNCNLLEMRHFRRHGVEDESEWPFAVQLGEGLAREIGAQMEWPVTMPSKVERVEISHDHERASVSGNSGLQQK